MALRGALASRLKPHIWTQINHDAMLLKGLRVDPLVDEHTGMCQFIPFWEGSGNRVANVVWHSPTATSNPANFYGSLSGSPTWTGGAFGAPAMNFPTNSQLDYGLCRMGDASGTVIAWVNQNTLTTGQIFGLFSSSSLLLTFRTHNDGTFGIQYLNNGTTTNNRVSGTTTALTTGKWYQLAFVSNGSSWSLYVNGILQTIRVDGGSNAGNWFSAFTVNANMRIGYDSTFYPINAKIDHIRVYSYALSQASIRMLYAEPFIDFVRIPAMRRAVFAGSGSSGGVSASDYRWFLM